MTGSSFCRKFTGSRSHVVQLLDTKLNVSTDKFPRTLLQTHFCALIGPSCTPAEPYFPDLDRKEGVIV